MRALLALFVTVQSLLLPHGATIDPFGTRSLMTVARNGAVAATVTVGGFLTRVATWSPSGALHATNVDGSIAAFDADGGLLVNAPVPQRWTGTGLRALDLATCENFPQSSVGPVVAGTLDNGSLIATMLSPPLVDLDDTSGQYAPVVLHLRSNQCLNMGNGVALQTAGPFTAGYVAYINHVPAPSNVVSSKERFVAMRWHERTPHALGSGVALAVASDGTAAGSDLPPGAGAAYGTLPHARVWFANGATAEIAAGAAMSVAYAVDARGRVAGVLAGDDGHRHAFVWAGGTLRLLDDAARQPDWHFACAYAFAPDGAIVGIGTYRGAPRAFKLYGL